MEKDWQQVHSSLDVSYINILKGMLESNGIQALILNQQDSLYSTVGEAKLYVHDSNVEKARQLINAQLD